MRYLGVLLLAALLVPTSASAAGVLPVEAYARYEPQTRCAPQDKPGAVILRNWLVYHYGGGKGRIGSVCAGSGVSEHKEGRAVDWTLDARSAADRARAQRMMTRLFATNAAGERHALARRMGVMYLIWDDRIYASYDGFAPRPYLSSSCRAVTSCPRTLRHRDHVHLSLSRAGGLARTSFYAPYLSAETGQSAQAKRRR